MMQSSSDVVKSRMEDLKKGRIGQGIAGLKEISDSFKNSLVLGSLKM